MSKLRSYIRRPSPAMIVALLALIVAASGAAFAIPDTGGEIHGCYTNRTGDLRVIDTEATPPETCNPTKEMALSWSQTGPPGADGTNGTNGTNGVDGSDVASAFTGRVTGATFGASGLLSRFAGPSGSSAYDSAESLVTHVSPHATIVARDLQIRAAVEADVPGASVTFTLRDDGVNTAVSCSISTTGGQASSPARVTAGQRLPLSLGEASFRF